MPGYSRHRRGKGFSYTDAAGAPLPPEEVERVRSLAIPPAWTDVWICPHANGHLQATGTDASGRRQYLYHPDWRVRRDRSKFDRVTAAAAQLPQARRRIAAATSEGAPISLAGALKSRDRRSARAASGRSAGPSGSAAATGGRLACAASLT